MMNELMMNDESICPDKMGAEQDDKKSFGCLCMRSCFREFHEDGEEKMFLWCTVHSHAFYEKRENTKKKHQP
jgi:hypothetical protein